MPAINSPSFVWRAETANHIPASLAAEVISSSAANLSPETITTPPLESSVVIDEKVIGTNNLRSISILERAIQVSRSVAHITIPSPDGNNGMATGFMIAPDIMMTNHHVFKSINDAKDAIIRFNYQIDLSGALLPVDEYQCDTTFFHTNEQLDYSIVKIKGAPGWKWGFIRLMSNDNIDIGSDLFIIQHPLGKFKQIALSDNLVRYVDDTVIQYVTDSLPGSSGSPVLDDNMRIIALHHSGGWIPEPLTGNTYFRNEGIRISAILRDMPKLD